MKAIDQALGHMIEGALTQGDDYEVRMIDLTLDDGSSLIITGKKLKAEFNSEPHVRGTASMARAASPDSADSQFFICFDDASFLNNQYTVWGKVTSGMENVDKIKRGEPVQNPDKIVKARMAADAA